MTLLYDSFGRQTSVASSDGSQSTIVYSWADPASDPLLARYSVADTANDGSVTKTWYDKLGRVIRSDVKGFDGTMICTSTSYNLKGQVESVSDPYFSTGAPQLNLYSYDSYGRQTALTTPSGRNSAWSYSNNTVTETTAGKSFSRTVGPDGNVSSATDPGGTITYSYFADGKVKDIVAPGSITTSMQYDIAGNQTSLADPSAGTISYTYNGFGELTSQVNPGSVTTSISYLSDGRIDQKTTPEGVTCYRYNSNKQLANIKSPSNVSRSLGYDSKGRVTAVTDTLPGSNPFVTTITYDSKGRKSTVTHPSAVTETYGYNQNGYLSSVSAGGSVRWTTTGINARGQLTTGTYGSNLNTSMGFDSYGFPTSIVTGTIQNYSFNFNPVTGNLAWRQNNKYTGLREDFQNDDLDRLTDVMKNSVTTLTMSYDGNTGGLAGKSDAGTFTYDPFDKPYALKNIDPATGLTPDSTQTIGYTSFNKVESISENGYEADFIYGSDDQRSRMIVKQNGNTILTRWYPTGSYLKETSGGVTKEYTFIGGDAYTAPVAAITQGGTTTYYNILRDHLGSITHIVSSSGSVVAEYSYDAWGRMRNPSTWVNYEPGSEPALTVAGRGFTGHEHLPWFNMINMNGRLYDPLVGMFLSPDNYIQDPGYTQSYNRYSYCINNPLIFTDPDGEQTEECNKESLFHKLFEKVGYWIYMWDHFGASGNSAPQSEPDLFGYYFLYQNGISVGGGEVSGGGGITSGGGGNSNSSQSIVPVKEFKTDYPQGGRKMPLGEGRPTLWIKEGPTNSNNYYDGYYQLFIVIYGTEYEEYNWTQSRIWTSKNPSMNDKWPTIEAVCRENNGFYYFRSWAKQLMKFYKARFDGDMYFEDSPDANVSFEAQLTLLGRKGSRWEAIQSFSWGYEFVDGKAIGDNLIKTIDLWPEQREWVNTALIKGPIF